MASFKQYDTKNGKKWLFQAYLGKDPITGKDKRTTQQGFDTKKEAQQALNKLMYQVATNNYHPEIKEPTYRDVFNMWLEAYKNTVKPSTYLKAMQLFKAHILPKFGRLKINKITIQFCQSALNDYATYYTSYKKLWSYVKTIFKYAIQLGYINKNVAEFVKYPKDNHEHIKYNFYTAKELQQFLKCVDDKYKDRLKVRAFFRTLAFSGMRKGEILALSWDDINFNDNTINIKHSISRDKNNHLTLSNTKNKSSLRKITMDQQTMNLLKQWQIQQRRLLLISGINSNNKRQLVFNNSKNSFITPAVPQKWNDSIVKQYHLTKRLRIHDFRHTHASILLSNGMQVKAVSERLGHSNIQTTLDIYTHVMQKDKDKLIDDFAKIINY